jgi:hypothetical protein
MRAGMEAVREVSRQGGREAERKEGPAVLCCSECHLKFSFANSFAVVMSMLSSGLAPSPVSRMTSSSVSSLIVAAMRVASLDAIARVGPLALALLLLARRAVLEAK